MFTIASIILFLAFYSLYYTSQRVPLDYNFGFEKWMHNNPDSTKIMGVLLLLIAYFLWLFIASVGSGTFLFLIELMAIGSLMVILKPLKVINSRSLFLIFFIMEFCEIYYS